MRFFWSRKFYDYAAESFGLRPGEFRFHESGPEWFLTAFPDPDSRRNHYGAEAIPDPYSGLSVLCLFLGEHQGSTKT